MSLSSSFPCPLLTCSNLYPPLIIPQPVHLTTSRALSAPLLPKAASTTTAPAPQAHFQARLPLAQIVPRCVFSAVHSCWNHKSHSPSPSPTHTPFLNFTHCRARVAQLQAVLPIAPARVAPQAPTALRAPPTAHTAPALALRGPFRQLPPLMRACLARQAHFPLPLALWVLAAPNAFRASPSPVLGRPQMQPAPFAPWGAHKPRLGRHASQRQQATMPLTPPP